MLHNKDSLIELLFRQKEQMQEVYRDFVLEESARKAYHEFFQILLESTAVYNFLKIKITNSNLL